MKHPILLVTLITVPIVVGALVYDQRDKIFGQDPGPLIKPVEAVLDDSWNLEKLGGTVVEPRTIPAPAELPQRPMPEPEPPLLPPPDLSVLYYANTCPHCQEVTDFVRDSGIAEKVGLVEKEVYSDPESSREAVRAAMSCGVPEDKMGVPFLFADGRCFFGKSDVIAYLKTKAGIQ